MDLNLRENKRIKVASGTGYLDRLLIDRLFTFINEVFSFDLGNEHSSKGNINNIDLRNSEALKMKSAI